MDRTFISRTRLVVAWVLQGDGICEYLDTAGGAEYQGCDVAVSEEVRSHPEAGTCA